jgi:hypothetical protein
MCVTCVGGLVVAYPLLLTTRSQKGKKSHSEVTKSGPHCTTHDPIAIERSSQGGTRGLVLFYVASCKVFQMQF